MHRQPHIDWLRTAAVWLVVLVHVAETLRRRKCILISEEEDDLLFVFQINLLQIGMPCLFYFAGYASVLNTQNDSFLKFVRSRSRRLLLPIPGAFLLVIVPMLYLVRRCHPSMPKRLRDPDLTYARFLTNLPKLFQHFGLDYLWFLPVLYCVSLVTFPLLLVASRVTNLTLESRSLEATEVSQSPRGTELLPSARRRGSNEAFTVETGWREDDGGGTLEAERMRDRACRPEQASPRYQHTSTSQNRRAVLCPALCDCIIGLSVATAGSRVVCRGSSPLWFAILAIFVLPLMVTPLLGHQHPVGKSLIGSIGLCSSCFLGLARSDAVHAIESRGIDLERGLQILSFFFYLIFYIQGFLDNLSRLATKTSPSDGTLAGISQALPPLRALKVFAFIALNAAGTQGLSKPMPRNQWAYPAVEGSAFKTLTYIVTSWTLFWTYYVFAEVYLNSGEASDLASRSLLLDSSYMVYLSHGLSIALVGSFFATPDDPWMPAIPQGCILLLVGTLAVQAFICFVTSRLSELLRKREGKCEAVTSCITNGKAAVMSFVRSGMQKVVPSASRRRSQQDDTRAPMNVADAVL